MRIAAAAMLILATTVTSAAQLISEQNGIDVVPMFTAKGFRDVEVTARHIDRVEAEACRGEARWRTTLFLLSGRVKPHERLGACIVREASLEAAPSAGTDIVRGEAGRPAALDAEDAAMRALERVGYTGVRLRRWGREGWRGTACRDGWLREVRVSVDNVPAAPIRAMRTCPPGRDTPREYVRVKPEPPIRHVRDVKARLLKRGYREVGRIEIKDGAFHANACEKAWAFLVSMDPKGTILRRRNLGRCATPEPKGRVSILVPAAGSPGGAVAGERPAGAAPRRDDGEPGRASTPLRP